MNDHQKKQRGRPRVYQSDADRKKAYRDRKKKRMMKLEERVRELEKVSEMAILSPEMKAVHEELRLPYLRLTPKVISEMSTEKLEKYQKIFRENIESPYRSVLFPILHLTGGEKLNREHKPVIVDSIQMVVLLYLIEAELVSRERDFSEDSNLDRLEQRIEELEKKIQGKML